MIARLLLPFLVLALLLAALPAAAAPPATPAARDGVVSGDLGPADGNPLPAAEAALRGHATRLGVSAAAFRFESVNRSLIGVHVRGREHRAGVPVDGSSAAVSIVDGRVVWVEARDVATAGQPITAPMPRDAAVARALRHLGVPPAADAVAERLLVRAGGKMVDAWRVDVFSLRPATAATVDVSAVTGRVLAVRSEAKHVEGSATVFDPNPVVTAKNSKLRQPGEMGQAADVDLDSAELTAQLRTLPLRQLDANALPTGRLVGPWVDVQGPAPHLPDGKLAYTRGDPRFESTMAYAHIDRMQRYFQTLGFTGEAGVNAEPQNVIAVPIQGFDNSFYQPGNDLMALGAGGVDDGEDAEVIIHEYGHAVHDAQVKGWGDHHEGGAMGEGFGDFLAATYYAPISDGFGDLCIMDWDATSYSSADPPCLRRMDKPKTYPKDMVGSVHADGELWSAFLWRVRGRLGVTPQEQTDNVLTLLLSSHELLTTNANFADAVAALHTAADALGRPEWAQIVDEEARIQGFPVGE